MAKNFKELQAKMPRAARSQRRGSQENDLRNGSCRTPRRHGAMGGELQIIANMPNGRVQIRQFTKIRRGEFKSVPTRPGVSLPSRNRRHD
jgi:hypothetical protein